MILVRGGKVLNAALDGLEPADVLIDGDTIKAVEPGIKASGAKTVDANGMMVLPGLINSHTHAHNNLTRGSTDNWTLEDLRNYGASVYANRTPEDDYLSAAIGAMEMLKTGCTAAYDQFAAAPAITPACIEAVVRAYADSGMRAVLAPAAGDQVFYRAVPGLLDILPADLRKHVEAIEPAPTKALLKIKEDSIRNWDNHAAGRIKIATAPVIPGECTDTFMQGCAKFVRDYGVSLHTHLAETKIQALNAVKRWGKTMVKQLHDTGVLGPNFVGGHGIWITDEDIGLMADAGATVAHNAASNLKLGSGIAPVREMLDKGMIVGLGADGSMASDNQNMFESMRFAALVSKVRFPHDPERWVGAKEIWKMTTTGAARVLGLSDDIGAIQAGRKADLILLRANSAFLMPTVNPLNALVYAETGAAVKLVMVAGKVVVEDGRILTMDEDKIRARAQEAVEKLMVRNRSYRELAQRIEPFLRQACRVCAAMPFPVNRYAAPVQ